MNESIETLKFRLELIPGNTTKVVVTDGPIAVIQTSTRELALPLASYRFDDFDSIVTEASKAAIVYVWEITEQTVTDNRILKDVSWFNVRCAMVYA